MTSWRDTRKYSSIILTIGWMVCMLELLMMNAVFHVEYDVTINAENALFRPPLRPSRQVLWQGELPPDCNDTRTISGRDLPRWRHDRPQCGSDGCTGAAAADRETS